MRAAQAVLEGAAGPGPDQVPEPAARRRSMRRVAGWAVTVLAGSLVWLALLAPNRTSELSPAAFVRIPVDALLVAAVAVVLPARGRRIVAATLGTALGLLAILKILGLGFSTTIDRPFDLVTDWGSFGPAVGVVDDSVGRVGATVLVVVALALVVALPVAMALSVLRLTRLAAGHRVRSLRAVVAAGIVWAVCAVSGAQVVAGTPVASTGATGFAVDQVRAMGTSLQDRQAFATAIATDAFRGTAPGDFLTGLRGKDVVVAFVESYGRVAVQGSAFSPRVDAVLDAGTSRLRASGFTARSAFLTSPTFGGISWLAHSTLQSGLWVDSQGRYDQLVASQRLTLSDAFRQAGWRTVDDVPSNRDDWPQGRSFYHYDKIYDDRNVGYRGPRFSYATMPDQYILSAFQRLELAKTDRRPVMAEIDLVSSHTPWAPLPHLVGWDAVGDGSVFDRMPAQGQSPSTVWRDPNQVRAAYGQSIEYSLSTLVSWVQASHDKNLVLVLLGDHQPATIVTGPGASHDVPITIIAHDPQVIGAISGWGWQDGLRPSPQAPVWSMDAFRDRFLRAYSSKAPPLP